MTYFAFLGLFLAPPIIGLTTLAILDSRANRTLPPYFQTWQPRRIILLHIIAAVLYTTPWDNYLVATKVWWYDLDLVNGMVLGWVPIEEYTFFILQTIMTGLWVLFLLRYQGRAPRALSRNDWAQATRFRWAVSGLLLLIWTISVVVLFVGSRGHSTYLVLILSWALPPILLQMAFGGDILWRYRNVILIAIISTTTYLCIGDAAAIAAGTWTISPQLSLGIVVGNLPLEEILFFLVTNTLVVFGVILMLARKSHERAPKGVISAMQPLLGRRQPPAADPQLDQNGQPDNEEPSDSGHLLETPPLEGKGFVADESLVEDRMTKDVPEQE